MKRVAITTLVILCCIAMAGAAYADMRKAGDKALYFGESFHKSPVGIKLTYLDLRWNEQGVTQLKYEISAWKGKIVWEDLYFVGTKDGKQAIVYKLSDKQKMGKEFCYLECLYKAYLDTMFVAPAVGPFDGETGEVWFVFRHGGQFYHVVWEIKTNKIAWYKLQDKPAPPVMTK